MSDINFSYPFQSTAPAPHHHVVGAQVGDGQIDPPYAPPSDWSSENSFDISIPYNADGTIDVSALLDKLHKILYYANQGDQMDFNSILDITSYIMNIAGVWSQLKAQGAAGQVEQFLNLPMNKGGQSILQIVASDGIQAMIYGTYYKTNGDQAATQAFANQLISTLQNLAGNTDILNPILQQAEALGNPNALSDWMAKNPASQTTFDMFTFNTALTWETDFSMDDSSTADMDGWRSLEIQDILSQPGVAKDPFLAYILIMSILMNENGDVQTQIAGRGNLINTMATALGNFAKQMNSQWAAGKFDKTSAQSFYNELKQLETFSQDKRFSSIASQIKQVFTDLTDSSSQLKVNDPNNPTGPQISIGQLYQDITTGKGGYTWDSMATALNSLQPSATPDAPTPPGFSALSNDLGQVTTSVTNASSAQGQIVQNLEGVNEQDLSFITATANEIVNADKVIVQNMGTAGN
jgi:hypothetical protein